MAVGKSKGVAKKGKVSNKRKVLDPFAKKAWYTIKSPSNFQRDVGKTLVTRSAGGKLASDSLLGRIYEVSLGDLTGDETFAHQKVRVVCEKVEGKECMTNFYGIDLTTDKARSLVKKFQTLIEGVVDVKTADGYIVRLFAVAFTTRQRKQLKRASYASTIQVKKIRANMVRIMAEESVRVTFNELTSKVLAGSIGSDIDNACGSIYPLQNVMVRKMKILRRPRNLDGTQDVGSSLKASEFQEPAFRANV